MRSGFLEANEYQTLLTAMPDHIKPLLVIGYHTGIRRGELLKIKWEQVDRIAGVIRLRAGQTKNGKARIVPIYGDMRSYLACMWSGRNPKCPYLFQYDGHQLTSFRTGWRMGCERAGITFLFHDLRRTAVRNMVRAGIAENVAMAISGHRTRAVFDRYNITSERDMAEAGLRLENFLEPSQKPSQSDSIGENQIVN